MNTNSPTIVDLFCGCGGFSLGAEMAGFHSVLAVDVDQTLQSSYRLNFPTTKAVLCDVRDIDAAAWQHFLNANRPDGVIGGPPCQGFSRIGKRNIDDPRNTLIYQYYRHIMMLRPKFFIMENVEGVLDTANVGILKSAIALASDKYTILDPIVVHAADFGAATSRKRVVVIGYDNNEVDTFSISDIQNEYCNKRSTVYDAIGDLGHPISESQKNGSYGWGRYAKIPQEMISDYSRMARTLPPKFLGWADALEQFQNGYLSGFHTTIHSPEITDRYNSILPGKCDPVSRSQRLTWSGLCPTLRAGTGSDKGSYQAVRPLHPSEGRVITVREAARLQGFPDWFTFHTTKWHSFRMIGNSVSPIVSRGLLSAILKKMSHSLAA